MEICFTSENVSKIRLGWGCSCYGRTMYRIPRSVPPPEQWPLIVARGLTEEMAPGGSQNWYRANYRIGDARALAKRADVVTDTDRNA